MNDNRVFLYDSTLRDGAQTQGVDFSAADKTAIAQDLDRLGLDYIEAAGQAPIPPTTRFLPTPPPCTAPSSPPSA